MKYIVKILTLSSALILTVFVVPTFANESNNTSLDPNTDTIDQSKIIQAEVKDGKLYIDILDDSNTSMLFRSTIGKCKTKYKTTTTKVSRSDLIKMRDELSNKNNVSQYLFGSFITLLFPIPGLVFDISTLGNVSIFQDNILKKVNHALDYKLKNSYTVKSSFKCEEGYLGSRGTVHRFVLEDITIS